MASTSTNNSLPIIVAVAVVVAALAVTVSGAPVWVIALVWVGAILALVGQVIAQRNRPSS